MERITFVNIHHRWLRLLTVSATSFLIVLVTFLAGPQGAEPIGVAFAHPRPDKPQASRCSRQVVVHHG